MLKKILIVDDHRDIRDLLVAILQFGPYRILQASNGPEAIELARRERPDVVLLDVILSNGMNGLEVCRWLKANQETRHAFVAILSVRGQRSDIEEGFAAGADDYFVKPFSPLELMNKVHKVTMAEALAD